MLYHSSMQRTKLIQATENCICIFIMCYKSINMYCIVRNQIKIPIIRIYTYIILLLEYIIIVFCKYRKKLYVSHRFFLPFGSFIFTFKSFIVIFDGTSLHRTRICIILLLNGTQNTTRLTDLIMIDRLFVCEDLVVVIASIVVLSVGSNGQVFATSAIRSVINTTSVSLIYIVRYCCSTVYFMGLITSLYI